MNTKEIEIEDYNYNLPDERIAKFPVTPRDTSKLLVYKNGELSTNHFYDLPIFIDINSLLIFNNTKVIQARLPFEKESGAHIEIFCLEPYAPKDYAMAFQQKNSCEWKCLVGNSKKWKSGKVSSSIIPMLTAERIENNEETSIIRFMWNDSNVTFANILEKAGELPIPPYLHRNTCEQDKETYQTVYSKIKGSVAAPTAGLHFTETVMNQLRKNGVELEEVTLHVGAGTFHPVKSEKIEGHTMHSEWISVKKDVIERLLKKLGHVVAVGTTSIRTIESLYYIGYKLEKNPNTTDLSVKQWEPYELNIQGFSTKKSLQNILDYLSRNKLSTLQTSTQIIIAPGYSFKIVNRVITNFHQPKSTLLLLISAYLDGDWKRVYDYAMKNDFRFLSYGDSSLLINDKNIEL